MDVLLTLIDFILPVTMLAFGLYYRQKKKESAAALITVGAVLCCWVILIRLLAPLSAIYLSLLNNGISLIVFSVTALVINRRPHQK